MSRPSDIDEIAMIGDLLTRGTPPAAASAPAARAALQRLALEPDALADDPRRPFGLRRRRAGGSSAGRRTRLLQGFAAVTATAAAVLAGVVIAGGTPGAEQPGITPEAAAPVTLSAGDILLAAAARAAREPATSGRFWRVKQVVEAGPVRVGDPPYYLSRRSVSESWQAADATQPGWHGHLDLGAEPRTDKDRDAWEADGSPTTWDLGEGGTVTSAPGQPQLGQHEPFGFLGELGPLTLAQVQALPTEPDALEAWLRERIDAIGSVPDDAKDGFLFGALGQLLSDAPAPPAVRAAAFAVMAEVPHVTNAGDVKDSLDRTGVALDYRSPRTDADESTRVVIDPKTYRILAVDASSDVAADGTAKQPTKESRVLVVTAEWTDADPTPPTAP